MIADPRTCSVVDGDCQRPPGYGAAGFGHADTSPDEFTGPARTCYVCGQDVCRACSRIRRWRVLSTRAGRLVFVVRRCRVCNGCRDEAFQHRRRREPSEARAA